MAFMNVLSDRRSMLKNGSRMGYFSDPHNAVCSRMCATPVSSVGVVRNATLNTLLGSSAPQCIQRAPVLRCSSSAHATEYSGTSSTETTSNAPPASFWPGTRDATAATAGESAGAASSLPALFSGAASTALAAKPEPRRAVTPATPPSRSGRRGMPRLAESCARTRLRVREGGQTREAFVVNAARAADIIRGGRVAGRESRDLAVSGAWSASTSVSRSRSKHRNVDARRRRVFASCHGPRVFRA